MNLCDRLHLGVLTAMVILVFCIIISSCALPTVLHPIEKTDIISVPKGSILITDPNSINRIVITKDGWFLSDVYVEEVMAAKVD